MDRVKSDFVPLSQAPNWTSRPKLFSRRNFIQTCFKKYDSLMDKITKLFALPKFGSLKGSTSASLNIGEISAIHKKLASF